MDMFGARRPTPTRRDASSATRTRSASSRCGTSSSSTTARSRCSSAKIHQQLRDHTGYQAIQALTGVGRTIAAIFVAEIGDVTRFRSRRGAVLVGGTHAPSPRVRHQGRPRRHHQDGLPAGALGGARGRRPLPRRPWLNATSIASPSGAARTKPASPSPASSSRSSTTACATARSAPSRRPAGGVRRSDTTTGELADRHDPPLLAWSTYVIEPLMVVAEPHHAPRRGRRDVSAAEPALPHQRGNLGADLAFARADNRNNSTTDAEPSRTASVRAHRRLTEHARRHSTTTTADSIDTAPLLHS